MESNQPQSFWCYNCKKKFEAILKEDSEVECTGCNNTFCELLEEGKDSGEGYENYEPSAPPHPQPNALPNPAPPFINFNSFNIGPFTYSYYSSVSQNFNNTSVFQGLNDLFASIRPLMTGAIPVSGNIPPAMNFMSFDQLLQYLAERDPKYSSL